MNKHYRTARTRTAKRVAVALIAAASLAVVPGLVPAGAAEGDLASVDVVRYGGADRYDTSLRIAEAFAAEADGTVGTVVMASGLQWTDSVVAASVAGRFDAPVLMTPPDELRDDALAWLTDVGASRIFVVSADPPGSDPTVRAAVTDALTSEGFSVERVSGNDQYRTGVAAARRLGGAGELARFGPTAIVASGEVFADALVAGPLAAHDRLPLLLTPKAGLHPDVALYLNDAGVNRVILMGGTGALSAEVQTDIETLDITVDRISGATRYETATMFGKFAARNSDGCFDGDHYGIARAHIPFDSFSAAPLLAQMCAPLVLTDPTEIPDTTQTFLDAARHDRTTVTLHVFGGNAAVAQETLETYLGQKIRYYKNRSTDSALPATDKYFIDHTEVEALFPDCEPPGDVYHPNTLKRMTDQMALYAGFDSDVAQGFFHDRQRDFVSGWWTDDKLQEVYGGTYPEIDVDWAKQRVTMWSWNQVGFGQPTSADGQIDFMDGLTVPSSTGAGGGYRGLYEIMARNGFSDGELPNLYVHHFGMQTPRRVDPDDALWTAQGGLLLWDWTGFIIQFPPVDREPAAWGMHTLLLARHPFCVAQRMLAICDVPITSSTSPHLRGDEHASPLGHALRNLICGEN